MSSVRFLFLQYHYAPCVYHVHHNLEPLYFSEVLQFLFVFITFHVRCAAEAQQAEVQTLTSTTDKERWRILTMKKGACKSQNEAMPHREAVMFAKEKDETWLKRQAAMTTVTKIHTESCMVAWFCHFPSSKGLLDKQHFISWREHRVIRVYNLDLI